MRHLLINIILLNQDQSNYCSIRYNGLRDVTLQSWQGKLSEAELEKGCHSSLDVIEKTACSNVINDCRDVAFSQVDRLAHITEHWLHEALAKGVKYVAHITSSELSSEPFSGLLPKARALGLHEFEIFDNLDEALVWIAFKNEFSE